MQNNNIRRTLRHIIYLLASCYLHTILLKNTRRPTEHNYISIFSKVNVFLTSNKLLVFLQIRNVVCNHLPCILHALVAAAKYSMCKFLNESHRSVMWILLSTVLPSLRVKICKKNIHLILFIG